MSIAAQLGYLGLEVSDLGAWSRFATDVFGLGIGARRPGGALPLRMDGHEHRFLLHEGPADDLAYIGWELRDQAALEAICGRLDRARIQFRSRTPAETAERGVKQLIVFEDPSGIRIEIIVTPVFFANSFASS